MFSFLNKRNTIQDTSMKKKKQNRCLVVLIITIIIIAFLIKLGNRANFPLAENIKKDIQACDQDIIIGNSSAEMSIFIYYSYTCPHCITYLSEIIPEFKSKYSKKDKVNIILKPVNLSNNIDINSALETLYCLYNLGHFDLIHELLMTNNQIMFSSDFYTFKEKLVMSNLELQSCISSHNNLNIIKTNNSQLSDNNVCATPTTIFSGKIYKGAMNIKQLDKIIKIESKKTKNQK